MRLGIGRAEELQRSGAHLDGMNDSRFVRLRQRIQAAALGANFDERKDGARSDAQVVLLQQSRRDAWIAPALGAAPPDKLPVGFELGLEGRIARRGWRRFRHGALPSFFRECSNEFEEVRRASQPLAAMTRTV